MVFHVLNRGVARMQLFETDLEMRANFDRLESATIGVIFFV